MGIIVPYPPGGMSDFLARILSQQLGERLGQSFVVENRPGVSGNIGAEVVAKSVPDGYTLLVGGPNNFASNQFLYKDLGYDIGTYKGRMIGRAACSDCHAVSAKATPCS